MQTNYVELLVVKDDGIHAKATGIAITNDTVLTVFHILEPGVKVATPNGMTPDGRKNATLGKVIEVDPYLDWCIIQFPENLFNPGKLRFAKTISVGEPVFSVTNMFGAGQVFLISHVAKLSVTQIYISPPMGKGASGAAMYTNDDKGRPIFIGMFQGEIAIEDSPTSLGYGLRAVHLKEIVHKYTRPPGLNVVPFDPRTENPQ